MTMALKSKNKLCFINGNLHPPSIDDSTFEAWDRCNTIVLGWIHRSITQTIAQSILWIEKASDAWHDLKHRFSQSDVFRICDLQEDLYKLCQGDKNVSEYFTLLNTMWEELENLKPIPNPIVPCACGAIAKMREYREKDQTVRFLRGLNEQYSHVRSQIMFIDPLPNVAKAFSLVIQQERQMQSENNLSFTNNHQTLAAMGDQSRRNNYFNNGRGYRGRGRYNGGRGQSFAKFYTHCNKNNHTIESCYVLHGFPPRYINNGGRGAMSAANAVTNLQSQEENVMKQDNSSMAAIQDQYQHILNLL
ncbi:uncharacterized protein LOC133286189 [Gastrolobium bilobum]|uniref:uncharacterized protein LOC133286189 n=1 Tax=Gastrolobium bilobum TaxID=150636 RepID=UPI002AB1B72F|nr:uncharacterized protein LOC133286189 [Gastrolobium bilobum]